MKADLTGKRVLFIAPRFFGYDRDIASELRRRGAIVDELRDRPYDSPFFTAVTRFQRSALIRLIDRLYLRELARFGCQSYDLVLVINGQTLSRRIIDVIRHHSPCARFILYMWDSVENRRSVVDNLECFDKRLSFDRTSAINYGMVFRPLFFSAGFEQSATADFDYHISFIGTAHTDRAAVVARVRAALAPDIRCYWYLYLQARWVFWVYKLVNPAYKHVNAELCTFTPLVKSEVQSVFRRSRAILDIEHPRQVGLTVRSFEAMGASKKLVTTNVAIKEYDFYCTDNICVIDRARPEISKEFLESAYKPIDFALYYKYSLRGWMDEVLAD